MMRNEQQLGNALANQHVYSVLRYHQLAVKRIQALLRLVRLESTALDV